MRISNPNEITSATKLINEPTTNTLKSLTDFFELCEYIRFSLKNSTNLSNDIKPIIVHYNYDNVEKAIPFCVSTEVRSQAIKQIVNDQNLLSVESKLKSTEFVLWSTKSEIINLLSEIGVKNKLYKKITKQTLQKILNSSQFCWKSGIKQNKKTEKMIEDDKVSTEEFVIRSFSQFPEDITNIICDYSLNETVSKCEWCRKIVHFDSNEFTQYLFNQNVNHIFLQPYPALCLYCSADCIARYNIKYVFNRQTRTNMFTRDLSLPILYYLFHQFRNQLKKVCNYFEIWKCVKLKENKKKLLQNLKNKKIKLNMNNFIELFFTESMNDFLVSTEWKLQLLCWFMKNNKKKETENTILLLINKKIEKWESFIEFCLDGEYNSNEFKYFFEFAYKRWTVCEPLDLSFNKLRYGFHFEYISDHDESEPYEYSMDED